MGEFFGGKPDSIRSEDVLLSPRKGRGRPPKRLLRVSDAKGKMEVTVEQEDSSKLSKDKLDTNDIFILDNSGLAIYIWVGKGANKEERKFALPACVEYLKSKGELGVPVARVMEGSEPQ